MIRDFIKFYRIWRKYHGIFGAIKCASTLILLHRRIHRDIDKLGLEKYMEKLNKEVRNESI